MMRNSSVLEDPRLPRYHVNHDLDNTSLQGMSILARGMSILARSLLTNNALSLPILKLVRNYLREAIISSKDHLRSITTTACHTENTNTPISRMANGEGETFH